MSLAIALLVFFFFRSTAKIRAKNEEPRGEPAGATA
jgi:hypothetical protein